MPWLAVPFKDQIHTNLKRIFEYLPNWCTDFPANSPNIVIFGPRGEFVEPFGENIIDLFGIPAYPFTRRTLAKLETTKLKELKLELLWDPSTAFRRDDGSQVPFSQLLGKKVLVFFQKHSFEYDRLSIKFLKMLKRMYLQTKGTHDEFEVIHIIESKIESAAFKEVVGDVPWLVSPASKLLPGHFRFYKMCDWHNFESTLLAFNEDGSVVRKTIYPTFDTMDFPFCTRNLEEEVCQLTTLHYWHYWEYYPYGGRIYSANDPTVSLMSSFTSRLD